MKELHILLVEDVPADFLLVERQIRQSTLQARIRWVKDAGELWRALQEGAWDVVLTDYKVPGLDFLESLQAIRRVLPRIPVILVSGSVGEETAVELMKMGLNDFVLKDRLFRLAPAIERSLSEQSERQKREEAECKLARNEQLMRAVLEGTPDAIFVKDRQGSYLLANTAAAGFTGLDVDSIIGKDDTFLFQPETAAGIMARDRAIMEGGRLQTHEEWLTTQDQKRLAFLTTKGPVFDQEGQAIGIFGIARDITARKEQEKKYRQLSQEYRLLLDNVPDGIIHLSRNLEIRWVNAAAQNMFHLEDNPELHARTCHAAFWKSGENCPSCPVLRSMSSRRNEIGEFSPKDDDRTFEIRAVPIISESGDAEGVIEIIRDITVHRHLEEQLRQAQKMESVGRLAGGVAHDYNNMLSVIVGYSELALEKLDPADTLYESLREIYKAAVRSTDITRQLLAFARKQTIAPLVLDLNEAVEGMLKMLRRLIGEDINLAWWPATGLWPVMMDPSQLDQLLANLCVNARDAIEGVGRITIETGRATFDTAYCADHPGFIPGEYVLLAVSDNGCGMDRDTVAKIFEPFFTTKTVGQGTGLGLATVYGIVKQNNGFINVYSEPDKGTTFKIYLTRHTGLTLEAPSARPTAVPAGHGEIILVVEDEASILRLAKRILEKLGYTVLTAEIPSQALRLVEERPTGIDLLITDVVMPEINGKELSSRLGQLCPGLKTLFMSGYTANAIAHRGVLDEGVNFIQKPFSTESLALKVREALG